MYNLFEKRIDDLAHTRLGGLVKKSSTLVFLLLAFCLALQIPHARALEKTLEVTTWGCRYELYVETPDTWQTGTQLEMTVRLTLVQKGVEGREIGYVTNNSRGASELLKWWIEGGKNYTQWRFSFPVRWVLVEYDEAVNLTEVGDFWEKQFQLEMSDLSASRLGRGESANATLYVGFNLAEFGVNHTLLNVPFPAISVGNIAIFKPFLTIIEAVVVAGFGARARVVYGYRSGRLSLFQFFSKLSAKYPFLTRVGSSFSIVIMWVLFVSTMFYFTTARAPQFSLAVYIAFALVAFVFVLLTVGLLEFILDGWGMLQTAFGFMVTIFFSYILYLAVEFLLL